MNYTVRISEDAELDLYEISLFVAQNNSLGRAEQLVDQIMERCTSLCTDPMRGHIPPELSKLLIKTHLQIFFKPFKIIYRIDGKTVWIDCILDGRRDLEELLQRRLTR
jgi:toxin ParE1/3/4